MRVLRGLEEVYRCDDVIFLSEKGSDAADLLRTHSKWPDLLPF